MNRWYLLGYSVLSFFIPLIDIGDWLGLDGSGGQSSVIRYIPVVGGGGAAHPVVAGPGGGTSGWSILMVVLAAGAAVLLVRTAVRWLSLLRLRQKARRIEGTEWKIYEVDEQIIPFSFGNAIYINRDLHTEKQMADIILHEYVHIRQRHTMDILVAELMCILNWYNPFCWLIRWSIRQNLEFIADQQVLSSGVERKSYQYHLLTVLGEPCYRLANNFNFSSLKKRIMMMNKMRSARLQLLKFLFIVPLAAVLLVAFRGKRVVRPEVVVGSAVTVRPVVAMGMGGKAGPAVVRVDAGDTSVPHVLDSIRAGVLYVVDGEKMPERWNSGVLSPDMIKSVDVVKGEEAVRLFGKRGANGVIAITLKDSVKLPDNYVFDDHVPVYVVDGKVVSPENMGAVTPDRIESISVHTKDDVARSYGEKGKKNGVIVITLKKEVVIVGAPRQQVTAAMVVNGEPWTITADTLRVSQP